MDGILLGAVANLFGSDLDAVGEDVAEPFALADEVEQFDDGFVATPSQLDAVSVFFGDDAVFEALDGEGDCSARADRVEAVFVAEVVGVDERVEIVDEVHAAERAQGLIFRAVCVPRVGVFRVGRFDALRAAGQRAVPAGVVLVHELVDDGVR